MLIRKHQHETYGYNFLDLLCLPDQVRMTLVLNSAVYFFFGMMVISYLI